MSEGLPAGTFIEVGHSRVSKHGQGAPGDTFISRKSGGDGRVVSVLSDGLGSGIKAGVLSTLTATMALKFIESDIPLDRAAEIIMSTLPVCSERGISYATFTLVDIRPNAAVRIVEYDNPEYVLVRQCTAVEPIRELERVERRGSAALAREANLWHSGFSARPGDRLVFFSDGVTQSGMGTRSHPLGWGGGEAQRFILEAIERNPSVSARELARSVVQKAHLNDGLRAKDDISCGVVYFRHPRDLLVMTGPPVNPERDAELIREFVSFAGRKAVCGGTTANIVSRGTGKALKIDMKNLDPAIPPMSVMEGADLVTEGIITLGRVAELLEGGGPGAGDPKGADARQNGATRLIDLILDSDRITFLVGTKINDAHQDPNMPVELEIRRNVVKKIQSLLKERYLKEASIRYV